MAQGGTSSDSSSNLTSTTDTGTTTTTATSTGSADREQAFESFLQDPKHGPSNKAFVEASYLPDPNAHGQIQRGYIRRADYNVDVSSKFSLNFMFNPETITRDYQSYLDQAALDPFNTIYNSGNLIAPPSFINFSFDLVFDRQIQQNSNNPDTSIPEGVLHDYQYFDIVVRNVPPFNPDQPFMDNGVMMINPQEIVVFFSKDLVVRGRPTNSQVRFIKFSHDMVPTRMEISLTLIISYFGPEAGLGSGQMNPSQPDNTYPALVPYDSYISMPTDDSIRAAASAATSAFGLVKVAFNAALSLFLAPTGGLSTILNLFKGSAGASNNAASAPSGGGGPSYFAGGATSPPGKMNDETAIADSYGGHTTANQIPKATMSFAGRNITVAAATVPAYAKLDAIMRAYGYPVRDVGGLRAWGAKKTGGSGISMHDYGLAVDVNATQNPWGHAHITDMPVAMTNEIAALKTKNGAIVFSWGGNWHSVQDCMHFQMNAFAGDVATGIAPSPTKGI